MNQDIVKTEKLSPYLLEQFNKEVLLEMKFLNIEVGQEHWNRIVSVSEIRTSKGEDRINDRSDGLILKYEFNFVVGSLLL